MQVWRLEGGLAQPLDQLQNRKAHKMQKVPTNILEIPRKNPPSHTPPKYENHGIFLVFSGCLSGVLGVFFRSLPYGEFGCRACIFGLFGVLWGFLLSSWLGRGFSTRLTATDESPKMLQVCFRGAALSVPEVFDLSLAV